MKKKKKVMICIFVLTFIVTMSIIGYFKIGSGKLSTTISKITSKVTKGDIKVEISGSGVVEPIKRYDITPLVSGNIISAPFEEGQLVKKGDIIYRFDTTELQGNIKKKENALIRLELNDKSTQEDLSNTIVYAGISGRLTNFSVKVNDSIGENKVGDISDVSYYLAKVPFTETQIKNIKLGQGALISSSTYMSSVKGIVSKISNYPTSQIYGVKLYEVEMKIRGNISLSKDDEVSATIGNMESPVTGKIDVPDSDSVISTIQGRVNKVYVNNNDYVTKGQKLFELDNKSYVKMHKINTLDYDDELIDLKSAQKQMENYNIKAPIDGIVLKKNYKAKDTFNFGASVGNLMVIADLSKVKFDMKIDELDINKMKIGQSVEVSADALPDKTFAGEITSIANEGTAVNGVSNYLVQVTIDKPGVLKSGMNVTAKTIVAHRANVLLVPTEAVERINGKSYVKLQTGIKGKQREVKIEIGISNKDYVEVIKGLKEDDIVVMPNLSDQGISNSNGGLFN